MCVLAREREERERKSGWWILVYAAIDESEQACFDWMTLGRTRLVIVSA